MTQDVRLYINDMLVDFSNELSIPFTYQLEDLNNPTIIKNSFTKTITIVGTKNNNKIFGEIYNLDREQLYDNNYIVGAYFNPSYRTPFILYRDSEIIESGYMQLNNVTIKNNVINYNITLYGGLGDFFYNLSYNENNEALQLKDLVYGVSNIENPDKEFDFIINKNTIRKCWENLGETNKKNFEDFITFIPSLNGLYEKFDNNKVLINTHNSDAFTQTSTTVDGKNFKTYNGYVLGELNKDYTEWEINSLRSINQRPALRVKGLIEACCNPVNNGGYKVELDESFFNAGNPYYDKAYIALPLLQTSFDYGSETEGEDGKIITSGDTWVGTKDGRWDRDSTFALYPQSPIKANEYGIIDISKYPVSTLFNFSVDFQLFFTPTSATTKDVYMSAAFTNKGVAPRENSILVQIYVYEREYPYRIVGFSDIYNFTNETTAGIYAPTNDSFVKETGANIKTVLGNFVYDNSTGKHYFRTNDGGNNTFRIVAENVSRGNVNLGAYLVLHISGDETYSFTQTPQQNLNSLLTTTGYFTTKVDGNTSVASARWNGESILSNTLITKQKLLKTEKKPLDYLLSYTKLFGLYLSKDVNYKTIRIQQRNNYFTGNIVDWSDKIDYSKDFVINPVLFDKKFYQLSTDAPDNYYLDKYKKEYGVDFGQKRINTNYNFNIETESLLKDNTYQNAVSVLDTSYYYRSFFNSAGTPFPSFVVDGLKYNLYNDSSTSTDIEIKGQDIIDLSKSQNWNIIGGYDYIDKLAFYTQKNDTKNLAEIDSCLVFFNDFVQPYTVNGSQIKLWVTDDMQEMYDLNDNPCHLYTETPFDTNNRWIAYPVENLPHFSRYISSENMIKSSWDFAVPKESFIPNVSYNDLATIYTKYLDDFYADQLDINTKKITAYVNLNNINVNEDLLKDFYYFNNCYWLLNKIENYDVNSNSTVKCEFIKINNPVNYTKILGDSNSYLDVDNSDVTVEYKSSGYIVTIKSSTDWEIDWYNQNKITNISQMSGTAGTTRIVVYYTENTTYGEETFYLSLTTKGLTQNENIKVDFTQKPNLSKSVRLYGSIKYMNGSVIDNGSIFILDANQNILDYTRLDDYTGDYSVYVPKDVTVTVEIGLNDGTLLANYNMILTEDTEYNTFVYH